MKVKEAVILGVSVLGGAAVFDGIAKSFPKSSNPAIIIGQVAVTAVNSVFAFGLMAGLGFGSMALADSYKKYEEKKAQETGTETEEEVTDGE